MSDSTQNVRILLGPVAQALIDGTTTNRPRALDQAIADLQERAETSAQANGVSPTQSDLASVIPSEMMSLRSDLNDMRRAFVEMKEIALAEMRMTRLLVGTLVDQGNDDHTALLRFAGDMIQKMYANSELLTKEDQQELERKEDLFERLNRMELERGIEPHKVDEKTEEITR